MPGLVTFWGTRGSIPTPGPDTVRYGGNTPCVTVEDGDGHLIVLDAGTGIRAFGRELVAMRSDRPISISILLTHTHWDHIQGLPFFLPQFRSDDRIEILGPKQQSTSLESILGRQMDPGVFPVPLSAVAGDLVVSELTNRAFQLKHFDVSVVDACHPGVAVGYSVQVSGESRRAIYLTDNELGASSATENRPGLVRFLRGADLLVHDAMYFRNQLEQRRGWGHSSAAEAVRLAVEAECGRLALFHHDPDHDDVRLEQLLDEAAAERRALGASLDIVLAAEGTSLTF